MTLDTDQITGQARQSIMALVGMLLVATMGAVFDWPWWVEYLAIAPLAIWVIISARLVLYRQLKPGAPDRRVPVVLVTLVMFAGAIRSTQYSGLIVFLAFAVVYLFSRGPDSEGDLAESKS